MSEQRIVWFGMKLTPQQKRKIEQLAQRRGVSQKAALLELVDEALENGPPLQTEPGSFLDAAHHLIGAAEGPSDVLRDPDRFEGYGA